MSPKTLTQACLGPRCPSYVHDSSGPVIDDVHAVKPRAKQSFAGTRKALPASATQLGEVLTNESPVGWHDVM